MADVTVPESGSAGRGPRDPWAAYAAGPRYTNGGGGADGADGDLADLARRLLGRLDGQEALLDRAADLAPRPDDRARVGELRDAARRMRRDGEALLLLTAADPGLGAGAPQAASHVLGAALAVVDEPSRAALRSVPAVGVVGPAAVELRQLVAQLVDEAAAASPGSRIEVGGRSEPDGALVVEIVVAGRGWTDALGAPRGPVAPRLAERLARRSTGGIRLERPLIESVEGLVATLHCPAVLVVGGRDRPGGSRAGRSPEPFPAGAPSSRSLLSDPLSGPLPDPVPGPRPDPLSDPLSGPLADPLLEPLPSGSRAGGSLLSAPETTLLRVTRAGRSGDELFGPLPGGVDTVSTPIFEAVASAWFRDDERGPAANEWSSPVDREWRAAAAAATRTDAPPTTATGLPRRSPGDRLVPPPREARSSAPDERVPERVRDRLATYQRGLRQGRHRADDAGAAGASEAWTAEGW